MIDISELWSLRKFLLWPAVGLIPFYFTKYIHRRWLKISARAVASVFFAVTVALLMLFLLVQLSCSEHSQLYSPDGKYVLVISYIGQGALGADYADILIRRRWSPFAKRIFHGEAQWDFRLKKLVSPEFKWPDSSHLVIGYYGDDATCEGRAEGIEITCVKLRSRPGE